MPAFPLLQYTFTATPLSGGAPVVVVSTTPEVNFPGLTPATQVHRMPSRMLCSACPAAAAALHLYFCSEENQVLFQQKGAVVLACTAQSQDAVAKSASHHCHHMQYNVSVVGTRPDGTKSPASNILDFVTPAAG